MDLKAKQYHVCLVFIQKEVKKCYSMSSEKCHLEKCLTTMTSIVNGVKAIKQRYLGDSVSQQAKSKGC